MINTNNTATSRLDELVDEVKIQLETLIQKRKDLGLNVSIDWTAPVWDLKDIAHDRNPDNGALNLRFERITYVKRNGRIEVMGGKSLDREPLMLWLEKFAKVACAYYLCEEKKSYAGIDAYLYSLRWLNEVVREYPVEGLHDLLPHHFTKVKAWLEKTSLRAQKKWVTCMRLASLVQLIDKFGLTDQRVKYVNPYKKPDEKKKDRTTPPFAMDMLYHCINNPIDDNERILMELLRLHVAAGDRAGETQTIPTDSFFNDKGGTLVELDRETEARGHNYGLRYLREKADGGVEIKPLDKGAYENVKIAVDALNRLCAPARARAKLLADMPGRFPLPKDLGGTEFYSPREFLTRECLEEVIGKTDVWTWLKKNNVKKYTPMEARAQGWAGKIKSSQIYLVLVADVEHACLSLMDDLVVLRHRDGTPKVWMHDLLCVVFEDQLSFAGKYTVRALFPKLVKRDKLHAELGNANNSSNIFTRRGLTLPDGSPIKIRTHQPRHTRNRFLDEAGLSPIQQAHAMGRDPIQNEYYQGGSDITIVQKSHLDRLKKAEHTARTAIVKDAVRARLIEGAITEAYHRLRDLSVIKAEEFLEDQIGQVLVTRFGACTNEWSGQSCPKHNKCFKRCKSYHVTGVDSERIQLEKELSIQRKHRAKVKELAEEKVYRADTALHGLDTEIEAIEEALAQWARAAAKRKELEGKAGVLGHIPVSVQVYPDGESHYKEVKRPRGNADGIGV